MSVMGAVSGTARYGGIEVVISVCALVVVLVLAIVWVEKGRETLQPPMGATTFISVILSTQATVSVQSARHLRTIW